jgi:hypothetical protein
MTLLARVAAILRRHDISFAIIGASALAVHGVSRSTFDIDLLTTDVRTLDASLWRDAGAEIDVRRGDADDPLAGVVRLSAEGDRDVDVVVGRFQWQVEIVAAATPLVIADADVRVVDAAGLVLLKLFAGGTQDAWDISQLLDAGDLATLVAEVDQRVGTLPADARQRWAQLRR